MTVRELMELLAQMDQDAVVVFPDTYTQSEGWEEGCEDATCEVDGVVAEDGVVVLTGE